MILLRKNANIANLVIRRIAYDDAMTVFSLGSVPVPVVSNWKIEKSLNHPALASNCLFHRPKVYESLEV